MTLLYVYKNLFKSLSLAGGYMRVGAPQIKSLPIKLPSEEQQEKFIKMVEKILALNKTFNDNKFNTDEKQKLMQQITNLDLEINNLVYDLYNLKVEERKVIETSLS